ncbi:hypothetical protein L1987_64209 [Smallanthus sonchifolius]|uniref:Uncharacterized protein n=1 Tax=Smallanthus sonchifolius TaxID=185202 RepID=A0ACB9CFP8_9ASTR|nr:hypothetical protein L1987_64209 [Smallanthus sonchifolius]
MRRRQRGSGTERSRNPRSEKMPITKSMVNQGGGNPPPGRQNFDNPRSDQQRLPDISHHAGTSRAFGEVSFKEALFKNIPCPSMKFNTDSKLTSGGKNLSLIGEEGQVIPFERIAWVSIQGVPMQLWESSTFNRLGKLFGKVVEESEVSSETGNLSFDEIGILVDNPIRISKQINIVWNGISFLVSIQESSRCWVPGFIVNLVRASTPVASNGDAFPAEGDPSVEIPENEPSHPRDQMGGSHGTSHQGSSKSGDNNNDIYEGNILSKAVNSIVGSPRFEEAALVSGHIANQADNPGFG